jgi:hypothetical protein
VLIAAVLIAIFAGQRRSSRRPDGVGRGTDA